MNLSLIEKEYAQLLTFADVRAKDIIQEEANKNQETLPLYERFCLHAKSIAKERSREVFRQNHPIIFKISEFFGGFLDSLFGPSLREIKLAKSAFVQKIKEHASSSKINAKTSKIFQKIFSDIGGKRPFSNLTPDQAIYAIFKAKFDLSDNDDSKIDLLIYNYINSEKPIIGKISDPILQKKIASKLKSTTTYTQRRAAIEAFTQYLELNKYDKPLEFLNKALLENKTKAIKNYLNKYEIIFINNISDKIKEEILSEMNVENIDIETELYKFLVEQLDNLYFIEYRFLDDFDSAILHGINKIFTQKSYENIKNEIKECIITKLNENEKEIIKESIAQLKDTFESRKRKKELTTSLVQVKKFNDEIATFKSNSNKEELDKVKSFNNIETNETNIQYKKDLPRSGNITLKYNSNNIITINENTDKQFDILDKTIHEKISDPYSIYLTKQFISQSFSNDTFHILAKHFSDANQTANKKIELPDKHWIKLQLAELSINQTENGGYTIVRKSSGSLFNILIQEISENFSVTATYTIQRNDTGIFVCSNPAISIE